MCMNLLRKLAAVTLPCTEADPATIDRLRLLQAAGHIRMLIPPAHVDCDDCLRQDAATVFEITPQGWKALAAEVPPDEEAPWSGPPHSTRCAQASRPKTADAALDLAQIAAWFSGTRHRSGE